MTSHISNVILSKFALAALLVLGSTGCAASHAFNASDVLSTRPNFGAANGTLTENFSLAHSVRPEPMIRTRDRGQNRQTASTAPQSSTPVHRNNIPL